MNRVFGLLMIMLIYSCQVDEEVITTNVSLENCGLSGLFSPEGFLVNLLGGLEVADYNSRSFHFIDDFNGYQIAFDKQKGKTVLLNTSNGGVRWESTDLPAAGDIGVSLPSNLNMKSIIFKDDKIASLFTTTTVLFKTIDGGKTWNYKGTKKGLQHYNYSGDRLYASNSDDELYVSENDGETWFLLSDHPNFKFWRTDFSFQIIGDRIFALGENDKLVVIDLDGTFIEEISPDIGTINGIHSIDDNLFLVTSYDKMVITRDGGASFTDYYDGVAEMISFTSEDNAIIIMQTDVSSGDGFYTCDEIAYTTDGGASWVQSGTCSMNLAHSLIDAQTMSEDRSVCLIRNCIFEIKRI